MGKGHGAGGRNIVTALLLVLILGVCIMGCKREDIAGGGFLFNTHEFTGLYTGRTIKYRSSRLAICTILVLLQDGVSMSIFFIASSPTSYN